MRKHFSKIKRIVIKAGTSILSSSDGRISRRALQQLGRQIVELSKAKKEPILVSSGAIAFGMETLALSLRPKCMGTLQACAAIGQGKLMHAYEQFFSRNGLHAGQLLLTRDGLENRGRFLRAQHTLEELLKYRAVPIVNENDTVATEEIAFGDNDILSVQVANMVQADLLVILSDVDGFFLRDGSRVRQVSSTVEIQRDMMEHVKDVRREKTVGGMRAKLDAATMAMRLRIPLLMVNGHEKDILRRLLAGEDVGTLFSASGSRRSSRQRWIAFSAPRKGVLTLDEGACRALAEQKCSLLPRGMIRVRGQFEKGEVVELENPEGKILGRGLVRYSQKELTALTGRKTSEIAGVLGYKSHDEVIHRNDMVIWD